MPQNEPIHTLGARSTIDSLSEGRLKVAAGRRRTKKKRKILSRVLDGVGGPGKKKKSY